MAYKSKYFQNKYGNQSTPDQTEVTQNQTENRIQYKSKYFQNKYGGGQTAPSGRLDIPRNVDFKELTAMRNLSRTGKKEWDDALDTAQLRERNVNSIGGDLLKAQQSTKTYSEQVKALETKLKGLTGKDGYDAAYEEYEAAWGNLRSAAEKQNMLYNQYSQMYVNYSKAIDAYNALVEDERKYVGRLQQLQERVQNAQEQNNLSTTERMTPARAQRKEAVSYERFHNDRSLSDLYAMYNGDYGAYLNGSLGASDEVKQLKQEWDAFVASDAANDPDAIVKWQERLEQVDFDRAAVPSSDESRRYSAIDPQGLDPVSGRTAKNAELLKYMRDDAASRVEQAKVAQWDAQVREEILASGGEELMSLLLEMEDARRKMDNLTMPGQPVDAAAYNEYNAIRKQVEQAAGDRMYDWEQYAERMRSNQLMAAREASIAAATGKNGWAAAGMNLAAVPFSLASGVGMLDVGMQKLERAVMGSDAPLDYNSDMQIPGKFSSTVRDTTASMIEEKTRGKAGSDTAFGNLYTGAYQLGTSMLDSAAVVGMTMLGIPGGTWLLGGSAGNQAMLNAKERGASDMQALGVGAISAVAEAMFEKVGIDNLTKNMKDATKLRQILRSAAKQAIPEAIEEGLTNITNLIADRLIMGGLSEYETSIRKYMAQGMSRADAAAHANKDTAIALATDVIGGAISGGIFGLGGGSLNVAINGRNNAQTEQQITTEAMPEAAKQAEIVQTTQAQTPNALMEAALEMHSEAPATTEVQRANEAASNAFGETGKRAFATLNDGTTNPEQLYKGFAVMYNAGQMGRAQSEVTQASAAALSDLQARVAYEAGQKDAEISLQSREEVAASGVVSVKEAGFVRNEYRKKLDRSDFRKIDSAAKAIGRKVVMEDLGGVDDGFVDENGVIHMDIRTEDPLMYVVAHEVTHILEDQAPTEHKQYRDYVLNKLADAAGGSVQDLIDAKKAAYSDQEMNDERAMNEIAASYTKNMMRQQDLFAEFANKNKNAARKLLDAIKALFEKIKAVFTGDRAAQDAAAQREFGTDVMGVEEAIRLWQAALDKAQNVAQTAQQVRTENAARQVGVDSRRLKKTVNGERVAWIENSALTSKQLRDHNAVANYIADHIGDVFTIIESGQKVYIGEDLPDEYTQSKYTTFLKNRDKKGLRAKNKAIGGFGDMIEIATNRRWEKTRHTQTKDAKYGMYRYDSKFAFPVMDQNGKVKNVYAYDVELLIRNASDGKKYLYDIVDIKEDTTNAIDLLNMETRKGSVAAASQGDVTNKVPQNEETVNRESRKGDNIVDEAVSKIENLVAQYGEIPEGENPYRDIKAPKKTSKDKILSQTVRTILEAKVTPDAAIPTLEDMITDEDFSYERFTDKRAMSEAALEIEDKGYATALADWTKAVTSGVVSKSNTALGWALYDQAATANDLKTATDVLMKMVEHQRSAAQAVQATRILKKMSPDAQLFGIQRSVSNLQRELKEKYKDKAPNLKIDENLARNFLAADNETSRTKAMQEIYRDIGRQVPSRFIDKWNAWRYLAMLGNVRTHIRNVVGNAAFAPFVAGKNIVATGLEAIFIRNQNNRTKALVGRGKADQDLLQAAKDDYEASVGTVLGDGKYSDFSFSNKYIEEGRRIFRFKPLEAARKGNSAALEKEDSWFAKPHYVNALAQYCKAHNISADQLRSGKALGPARAYAVREAQKATYRDMNAFSNLFSRRFSEQGEFGWVGKLSNTVMEGVLPFRKTPANILARGVEYSPIGLLKGLSADLIQVKKGNMTGAEAIDHISSGFVGTALMGFGFVLAKLGLVRGVGDEDKNKREFEDLQGHQAYALELPDGSSVTLDWLAPEALPFFVGVNLYEGTVAANDEMNMADVMGMLSNITAPMLEMSCLQGLNDLIDSVGYASSEEDSALFGVLVSATTSYLTQALPTILGQGERTAEEERMTTYTDKNKWLTTDAQYAIGKASARIPGVDYGQIPYIDAWGTVEKTGEPWQRAFNNFINPAYYSQIDTSAMEEELVRLYDQVGESYIFPSRAAKYFNLGGERIDLTAEQYVTYATEKGRTSYNVVTDIVSDAEYADLTDGDKARAIQYAYEYANAVAKTKVSEYQPEGWVAKALETCKNTNLSVARYIFAYMSQVGIESLKDSDGDPIDNSASLQKMEAIYNIEGLTNAQYKAMFADCKIGKSVINLSKSQVASELAKMRRQAK